MNATVCANKRKTAPSKFDILSYWAEQKEYNFVVDIWEPSCFACERNFEGRHDPKVWCEEKAMIAQLERFPLEKAHIIPHSLGGTNDESNYVLLCKDCHRRAPMFPHRDMFLQWVTSQKHHLFAEAEEFASACECIGLDWMSLDKNVLDEAIKNFADSKMFACHVDPMFGPRIPRSTLALHIKHFVDRM